MPNAYKPYDFANLRHIGPNASDIDQMVNMLGFNSLDAFIDKIVPSSIRLKKPMQLGEGMSEHETLDHAKKIAQRNQIFTSLIGQGYYGTLTPTPILRNILENPAWYTAYTPYQPEISQGRLEALLNFQTMISDLTGLEIANASLLDEATAAAEAMTMAKRTSKVKSDQFFIDENCHPQNIALMQTRAEPLGIQLIVGDPDTMDVDGYFGAIFQYPGTHGQIRDFSAQLKALNEAKAIGILIADPLALTLLKSPADLGAAIAVGSTQRFGVPLGYGGPHAAYMACKDQFKRAMPGRIVGVSVDAKGRPAYRLALQTREQHIRREKANSNVCTAQALLAVMASMYAVYHGPKGLISIAQTVRGYAEQLRSGLKQAGFKVSEGPIFDTFWVDAGDHYDTIVGHAEKQKINFRKLGQTRLGISLDECTNPELIEKVWRIFGIEKTYIPSEPIELPRPLKRDGEILTHEIFQKYPSEAEFTRYMRQLADRDLALDRAMIPLGSCTMKLNATTEMIPVTWPEFTNIHPYAPKNQTLGYQEMMDDLNSQLCEITGYDAISQQPNSGAQGEYAGLITIRNYHKARGQAQRDVCLIPTSAHGTNPASAQMVGWQVVPVAADEDGNIDLEDYRTKAETYSDRLAAVMITYPSTHGVFEETVHEVCAITHQHGGQVYIDGANMNAMVGLSRPGDIGGDVSHLNLHKTFCIPHGGGGPGMGPIGVKQHLAAHLPGHPETDSAAGPVSAAPFGSASILPVSWTYILMMGAQGLTQASKIAILSANYIAARLKGAYDILYTSKDGLVAHECILDTRILADQAGVSVDDIAKRLMDHGFHAPTMSWPVAGTLMVEPTESEPKAELDRFCDAMLDIFAEAEKIKQGTYDRANNPLANAPHTLEDILGDWQRPYSREQASLPKGTAGNDKYWPPVNRIDNAVGDRNLVCTCPSMEAYADAAE